VIDAPLLLESGLDAVADVLVFVDAPESARATRAAEDRGWAPAETGAREARQAPLTEKRRLADEVVSNDGSRDDLERRVTELHRRIVGDQTV
jgi:dephospho-CoA kinase